MKTQLQARPGHNQPHPDLTLMHPAKGHRQCFIATSYKFYLIKELWSVWAAELRTTHVSVEDRGSGDDKDRKFVSHE